jgi:class 3 adenylate cyclase
VTVVFSDMSGSTALGERLDPESLSQVMARYYEAMRAVVRHHGGTVEKFAGDAVMAVFGIPAAHEDDALRATRAAADMHAALGDLNEELWRAWGVRLELHTGVNTGEVVAGDPSMSSSLVVGDPVNLAARLEQAAGPGEILLGRGTWNLVRDAARLGFDDPDFLTRVQGSRDALANRVGDVLREAASEAGDDPVDPDLLLTLTKALAAAFDPHQGAGH